MTQNTDFCDITTLECSLRAFSVLYQFQMETYYSKSEVHKLYFFALKLAITAKFKKYLSGSIVFVADTFHKLKCRVAFLKEKLLLPIVLKYVHRSISFNPLSISCERYERFEK